MKSYGLENVRLEPWEIPVGWERGHARMKVVEPGTGLELLIASAGWTPGTKGKVVGEVVILKGRLKADLEKYKGKLKNAVVLTSPPANVAPITDLRYGPGMGGGKKDDGGQKTEDSGEGSDESEGSDSDSDSDES